MGGMTDNSRAALKERAELERLPVALWDTGDVEKAKQLIRAQQEALEVRKDHGKLLNALYDQLGAAVRAYDWGEVKLAMMNLAQIIRKHCAEIGEL